jgi:hypothetical protein
MEQGTNLFLKNEFGYMFIGFANYVTDTQMSIFLSLFPFSS